MVGYLLNYVVVDCPWSATVGGRRFVEPCDDEPLRGVEMSFGFGSVSVGAGLPPRLAYETAFWLRLLPIGFTASAVALAVAVATTAGAALTPSRLAFVLGVGRGGPM